VLTTNYGLTSWLSFYLPSHPPVVQVNERFRWDNEAAPDPDLFNGPLIYVCRSAVAEAAPIEERYKNVNEIAMLARQRAGIVIERYSIYAVEGVMAEPPLDQRTIHDVLKQQRVVTQQRLALERSGQMRNQTPPAVESCERKIDHAAAHDALWEGAPAH
jgi:hypothetical protein